MKYLLLIFCLVLCSCEPSWVCVPINSEHEFEFDPQGGIDSTKIDASRWKFTGVREWFAGVEKEKCEVKSDTIKCSWFSVIKRDSIVFASVKQNDTGKKRYKNVEIKGKRKGEDECWGVITISQCFESTDELSKEEFLFSAKGGIDSVTVTKNIGSVLALSDYDDVYKFVYHYFNPPYIIESSWYTISIPDEKKMIFSVSKNETGKERSFTVALYLDYICEYNDLKIIQSAE
jgi:hypothetical protein